MSRDRRSRAQTTPTETLWRAEWHSVVGWRCPAIVASRSWMPAFFWTMETLHAFGAHTFTPTLSELVIAQLANRGTESLLPTQGCRELSDGAPETQPKARRSLPGPRALSDVRLPYRIPLRQPSVPFPPTAVVPAQADPPGKNQAVVVSGGQEKSLATWQNLCGEPE